MPLRYILSLSQAHIKPLLSYKVKKKSTRSYYGLEREWTRKEEERMKHGGLKKNKREWMVWDVEYVKDVEYAKNVENVEIIKGRDAVKDIPSF